MDKSLLTDAHHSVGPAKAPLIIFCFEEHNLALPREAAGWDRKELHIVGLTAF